MTQDFQCIRLEFGPGRAILTLNRPAALNAIDPQMLAEIGDAVERVESHPDTLVLILTGAGERAFCSGMDLRAFQERAAGATPLDARGRRRRANEHPLSRMAKPVIAAVNGLAYGGGLELCLLSDLVIAADHATFAAAEVTRGLMPGNGATQRLPRKIGPTRALEMLLTGRPVDASRALMMGLVNEVVPAGMLPQAADRLAASIAANGPVAVRMIKEAAMRGLDLTLAEGLELESDLLTLVQQTDDAKEGVRAFLEKRKPSWTGK